MQPAGRTPRNQGNEMAPENLLVTAACLIQTLVGSWEVFIPQRRPVERFRIGALNHPGEVPLIPNPA